VKLLTAVPIWADGVCTGPWQKGNPGASRLRGGGLSRQLGDRLREGRDLRGEGGAEGDEIAAESGEIRGDRRPDLVEGVLDSLDLDGGVVDAELDGVEELRLVADEAALVLLPSRGLEKLVQSPRLWREIFHGFRSATKGKSGGVGMLRKIQSEKFWVWIVVALIPIVPVFYEFR
jgi:hypothetical protein